MCVIVDANVASIFFCAQHADYQDLIQAVFCGKCCLVYGGQLKREYSVMKKVMSIVLTLDRAGRARAVPDDPVDNQTATLVRNKACSSDDEHVIALASVSHSRLLCTDDSALEQDFTTAALLSSPRGNIYKRPAHRPLIRKHCRAC